MCPLPNSGLKADVWNMNAGSKIGLQMVTFSHNMHPSFVLLWQLGKHFLACYFPNCDPGIAESIQRKAMLYITTCQEVPVAHRGTTRDAHLLPGLMTTTWESSCLFKEQDMSTALLWQPCQTESGPSRNYLSTRSLCFIALPSFSQPTHPLFMWR